MVLLYSALHTLSLLTYNTVFPNGETISLKGKNEIILISISKIYSRLLVTFLYRFCRIDSTCLK